MKAKRMIDDILRELGQSPNEELAFKPLESTRGFFVHVQGTYPAITPYLKGMHLTLDSWRPGRDADGWKVKRSGGFNGFWDEQRQEWVTWEAEEVTRPAMVKPVPRFRSDVEALRTLMVAPEAPIRLIRSKRIQVAIYGFGDASGVGFGSSFQDIKGLLFRHGVWGRDADDESSNFRELRNLVEALEEGAENGELLHSEVFIFTDNSTAESVFYKGNTTGKRLFELVLRLRRLEMAGSCIINMIHVAGTRMIRQGTDGLSRGLLNEGVMAGASMLSFVLLNEGVLERQPNVLKWVRDWTGQSQLTPLQPEDWYERGHGWTSGEPDSNGLWMPTESGETWMLWVPPPAAADVALEELLNSRHKRDYINHVVVIPRLMTHLWRKRLHKLSDLVFEVPAGSRSFWPALEHEPLIVGLMLRFSLSSPWQIKYTDGILEVGGQLRRLWKEEEGSERAVLREFCQRPGRLEGL
jgi:hypothetical protein